MNRKAGRTLARKIGAAMMAGLFMADSAVFAAAPIMPDAGAPASRHPLVQETANGIPLVHIAAPSASGVSRNDYDRFNVPEKGAILNNSYTLSKTELAGYVQGNPNMAKGPARIIVNQVTGSSATAMNGFLEVAGNKADVVIANPNGITVNGGGFINTGRAILATGKPEFDAGENLEDLRVNGNGTILIDGKGLDGRKADSLAIYTRAARVNAAIWANTLHVTTGANTVEAETGKAVPITPEGKKPEVALDVSAVGGMYAGRIFLVGTEKGLGFRMDGHMNTDDLILDADGHLYHSGTIHAAREADLEVSSLEHQGTLVSEGKLKIQSDGNLVNTGTLGAGKELAVQAAGITNDRATIASEGTLSIETTKKGKDTLSNREGKILSNGTLQVRTNSLDNTKGTLSSGVDLVLKGNTLTNEEGKITAFGNSQITEKEKVNNRSGSIEAHGDISLSGNQADISGDSANISGNDAGVSKNTLEVDNHNGTMDAGGSLTVTAATLQLDGTLAAGKDMTLHTGDSMTNDNAGSSYGITRAGENLSIETTGTLTNSKKIEAGKTLSIEAAQIENRAEGELNGKSLSLKTQTMTNRGLVNGDRDLSIETGTLLNLETGRIYGEDISINAGRLENRKDKALEESLAAAMKTLQNKEKALDDAYGVDVTAFHSDGEKEAFFKTIEEKILDYEKAKSTVDGIRKEMEGHPSAALAARGSLTMTGNTLLNSSGALLYSGGDMAITEKESVINRGGTINAQGNFSITAPVISNENESFSSERVWTSHVTNPKLIRIDQDGHPERGQAFPESEFSRLSSGYGAYHNKGITPKEPLEEAAYGIITAPTEEELAEGEDPVDPSLVGTLAPNYAYDDPIFQQFGITSMTTARPKNGDPAQKAWDESYRKILDALNVKIREYNREVEAYNNSIGAIEGAKIKNYTIIRTNTHTSEKKVTETKAGILSGGKDMTLVGNVTNENSRITAGKTLAVQGNLTNEETKNQVEKVTFGTTQESYTKKKHFPHKAHRRHYRSEVFMTPQKDLENPTSFGVTETKENSSDTSDSMDITKAERENVHSYLNPFQSGKETHPGTVTGDKGTSIPFLSESALYRLYPEETATYLVETDPAFTNKHRFLSSDYMYRQMTWDPDRVTKRLGDGFYEQELVRQQIAGLTGMRYLNGYTDDEEEYKALMDRGLAFAKEYNLKPGISLTKEQMASLTSDMVWLEPTTVTVHGKTYEVLYPKVYLKPGTMTLTSDGSLISADTLVAETKETLENKASILGTTVVLKGNDGVNRGSILGKDITLKA
uniref:two-partner secretion domain-containing protein n=1 Tax=Dialister succinatiphilus TaxID=487173 RepID=UPI0040389C81